MSLLADILIDVVAELLGAGLSRGGRTSEPFAEELAHIRKRRRWLIGLSLLFVPVVVALHFFTPKSTVIMLAVAWIGWIAIMGVFLIRSRCPCCQARFFRVGPQMLGRVAEHRKPRKSELLDRYILWT
jgi:hypothetical protein